MGFRIPIRRKKSRVAGVNPRVPKPVNPEAVGVPCSQKCGVLHAV